MSAASDVVLQVAGLSKRYCHDLRRSLAHGVGDIARELWPRAGTPKLRRGEFLALDDVSFDLRRGEALAVVGGNGAGKSTLLRILLGLIKPDAGEVRIRGRVGAILDLGAGLHDTLSGRENLALHAALSGLSDAEARDLTERAADFAELGAFIDDAVQSYSTGMRARLSYAAAAQMRPDILLVDEALAVGDVAFQRKCIAHMRAFVAGGGALLLVSHNGHQVQAACSRGVLLEKGRVVFAGGAMEALNAMYDRPAPAGSAPRARPSRGPVRIAELRIDAPGGIATGEPAEIMIRYRADAPTHALWGFSIWTDDHELCVTGANVPEPVLLSAAGGELRCRIPRLPLAAGHYRLEAALLDPVTFHPLARIGQDDGGIALHVPAGADPLSHLRLKRGQLVEIDVEWPR